MSEYLKYYKSIYKEDAISVSQISSNENFCLMLNNSKDYKDLVFYDKSKILENTLKKNAIDIPITSIYSFGEMESSKYNPYDCWSVIRSAAVKGYGAFLYDTLLSLAGKQGLMPDRGSVSDDARNVWEFYFYRRKNEFTKIIKIDNYLKPETIDKQDDGNVHYKYGGYDNRDVIDHIYYFKNYNAHLKNVKKLKDNNTKFLKELSDLGYDPSDFKIELYNKGSEFFSKMYRK